MSDLNDFFAKKDRKKKKAAAKSVAASSQKAKPVKTQVESERVIAPPQPKQPDDGWIEIEDPKGSQVNTGGRTVLEFRRDVEEKEVNGDRGIQTEKFSGWGKVSRDLPQNATDDQKSTAADAPRSAFPTLADAAKVKNVPSSAAKPSTSSATGTPSRRPRFINSQPDKLRQKLAERSARKPK